MSNYLKSKNNSKKLRTMKGLSKTEILGELITIMSSTSLNQISKEKSEGFKRTEDSQSGVVLSQIRRSEEGEKIRGGLEIDSVED